MYECRTSLCRNISTNMVMCFVAIDLFYGFRLVDPLQLCELQLYISRACLSLDFDSGALGGKEAMWRNICNATGLTLSLFVCLLVKNLSIYTFIRICICVYMYVCI